MDKDGQWMLSDSKSSHWLEVCSFTKWILIYFIIWLLICCKISQVGFQESHVLRLYLMWKLTLPSNLHWGVMKAL